MWPFLDPIECRQADQCLAQDQPLEAARILLATKARDHKAVRERLLRIGPTLIEQARQAFDAGDRLVAAELLACAEQCGELPPDARTLQAQIAAELLQNRQQQDWEQRRLEQADRWARDGRLRSALGMIDPLADDDPTAARRRLDWRQAIERLDRHAAEFRDHLAQEKFPAAAAVLQKARELAPDQPHVLCLEQELANACPTAIAEPPPSVRLEQQRADGSRLLLSGLSHSGDVLILAKSLVTIGTSQDAAVDLPMQALLRRRHALLIRESSPGPNGQCHRLLPLAGAAVQINQRPIADGETVWLAHGDLLQFGPETCQWQYRRPVAGSATAVLQQARPGGSTVLAVENRPIARIVLFADDFFIGRETTGNHLVEADFPVERLTLTATGGVWRAATSGGVMFIQDGGDAETSDRPLRLPAELHLYADDPKLLERTLQGRGGEFRKTLKLVKV